MPETDAKVPPGVLGILTDETGRVVVAEADFERGGYGGFTLAQAQRIRLKQRISGAMVRAYASPQMTRAMSAYDCDRIMDELCRQHGYRLTFRAVGHSEDDAADVARS